MTGDDSEQTRRRFLTAGAALGMSTAIAGCGSLTEQFGGGGGGGGGGRSFSYGTSQELTLREGDGRDPEYNDLAKPVTFQGSSGDTVSITMTADFDTYLVLEGPNGSVVAENDDIEFGTNLNSRIRMTLSDSGQYTIWCGSLSGDATGPFTLSLEQISAGGSGGGDDAESISYGASQSLTLQEGDGPGPEGDLAKPVTFQGSSGDNAVITMTAEFDTLLLLEGPDGTVVAENDDRDIGTLNSRIETTLSADGEYTIWCGSFSGSDTGPFDLTLEQRSSAGSGADDAESISYGASQSLTLQEGDGTGPEGDLAKPVTFQGSSGDDVSITMTAEFDTLLLLEGPDGTVVAENDDIEIGNLNSRIQTTLSADGEYTIWCGSFSGFDTGPFDLTLERA